MKSLIMEKLPNEMFAYIFEYLNGKEILNMLLVSKRINNLISSDSTLMRKIKLVFDFDKFQESTDTRSGPIYPHDLLQSKRNYQNLQICGMKAQPDEPTMQIFKKFKNIKSLTLENCRFRESFSCIRPLLDIWKTTLHQIELKFVRCFNLNEEGTEALKFDCLRQLFLKNSNLEFLKNFTKSELNELEIISLISDSETEDVLNFLELQAKLKNLKLYVGISKFLQKADLSSVKFQLDSLECTKQYGGVVENLNYHQFVKNQAESLNSFFNYGFCSENVCRLFLNNMPKLKRLKVYSINVDLEELNYNEFSVNNSIVYCDLNVTLPNDPIQNILKFMKNLRVVLLGRGDIKFLFEADLKFLEELRLNGCTAEESVLNQENGAFVKLKRMSLVDCSWELTRHLIMKNPQLNSLTIDKELENQVRELISSESLHNLEVLVKP